MAGRPGTLPWNMATFTGSEPVTTLSDNFSFLNNQINDSGAGFTSYAVDTGTANNLIVTLASAPVAYEAGMMVCTVPAFTSTGASVINVNALGNVPIVNPANLALNGGELTVNQFVVLIYDGTSFRIAGPCCIYTANITSATPVTFNVAGYTGVAVSVVFTAAGQSSTFSHLGYGVPIWYRITNSSGASSAFGISGTNAAGSALSVNVLQSGQPSGGNFTAPNGYSLTNNAVVILQGTLFAGTSLIFGR